MRIGSLFSGAAGLDRAVAEVFGGEVAWFSEVDPAASRVLAHHFPTVPNLGDITQVDWADVPPVDVLCGGFPCQDVSAAGKRAGIKDGTRSGLWSVFAEAIDALRPRYVVIENVRGLLSATAHRDMEPGDAAMGIGGRVPVLRAAGAVLGDLAELGYDAQWTTLAAAAVGAPHRRERVFILASAADAGTGRRGTGIGDVLPGQPDAHRGGIGGTAANAAVTERRGAQQQSMGAPVGSAAEHRERASSAAWCHAAAPDSPRNGWHQGRPESARLGGGSDAAVRCDGAVDLLPTPSAADGGGGHLNRSGERGGELLLPGIARAHATGNLLSTPNASDGSGGGQHPDKREGHSRQLIDYVLADAGQWGKYAPAIARWEAVLGRPAPAPTEPNRNGKPRLNPEFSSWMMGWPAGWVTDPAIGISRNDQLRCVGNGVVTLQAVVALRYLLGVCEMAA